MSEIDLLGSLPPWFRGIEDYRVLMQTEQQALTDAVLELGRVQDNATVQRADATVIAAYERLLDIVPNPAEETLGFRRERVLAKLANRIPYTWASLLYHLGNISPDIKAELDYPAFKLYIRMPIPNNYARIVAELLRPMLPAHIWYSIRQCMQSESSATIYCGARHTAITHATTYPYMAPAYAAQTRLKTAALGKVGVHLKI